MTAKAKLQSEETSVEQELHDEIESLRAQLSEAQALLEFRDYRRQQLSKMLKLGIWEWDEIENRPIAYSDEMADVFGVDPEELSKLLNSSEECEKLVHPQDREHYRSHADTKSILQPGVCHVFDYRIVSRDGETRQLREFEQGVFDDDGELVASFGMVQDITETTEAIRALQDSEQRYQSLFAQMPLGVQEEDYSAIKRVVDKLQFQGVDDLQEYFLENPRILREMVGQTHISHANEALVRLHEASSLEEFLATEANIDEWWDAQWIEYYAAEIASLAKRHYYESERVDSRVDNSYFETRTLVTVVRGFEETWERVITIHEDITDRKRDEAALIEAKTQAEEANRAKSEFLSSMSHELRTPLNAILGFSQLFAYDRNLSEQHLNNANEINRAGRHLMSLIDQILDLSRIEAGETEVSLEPVSLQQVLSDSVHWVAPLAHKRNIDVDYDESRFGKVAVLADTIRLKQVFLNLLTNAVKYNREGGCVNLVFENSGDDRIRIGVRDNGSGISSDKLKELFQPFKRLGAEFSTVEGTGIGLVITRQLLDLMHGKLEIDSEPGKGSTFWVNLELTKAAVMEEGTTAIDNTVTSLAQPGQQSSRILVAEDNLINQELMAAQLELLGYEADYVEDGAQALDRWRQHDYGLLLTDIRMPEMNGYDLVREIRQLEQDRERRAPVIAITANALEADINRCYQVGVDEVISKPVELDELRDALQKWAPVDELIDAAGNNPVDVEINDGSALDINVLVQSTGDKPDLHRHLLESYDTALVDELENIQQAFAWKNSEQLGEYAHKLKSSSRSLGAMNMSGSCQQLEAAAQEGDWDRLEALMPRLRLDAQEVGVAIANFLDRPVEESEQSPAAREFVLELPDDDDDDITQFSIKVLLVDDDYIMHRVTTVMLNDLGISGVLNAMSGPSALEMLQEYGDGVDVVICDLNMPEMDGVEFIRHLSQRNFSGSVILTSGEDVRILKTVEKLAIEHELHVLGVMEKPATPAKLTELLDAVDQIRQEGTMMMVDPFNLVELDDAIRAGQLDTYFQPKVDIASGEIVGVEALVRWNHPIKGLIKPNAFITMAEENGLIGELTDVVCHRALDYAGQLKKMGHDLNIAINISVDSLTNLEWPDRISQLIEQSGLDASSITFEITESRLMEHLSVALDILSRLSLKRFNLSIDDFGTGYSSMEQLQRIPFAEFKIDRAFVHGAAREDSARAILESSVLLAKKLDMKVVAEGVEDQDDWDLVARIGCDQVQGYFVARPLPFQHLVKFLNERKKSK